MQGPVVLPEDIRIVPLTELPETVRAQVEGEEGDYAITRPQSRTPSKVIDSSAAALLKHFEKPVTIADAILRYSRSIQANPQDVLEQAYPLIETCLASKLLVEPGEDAEKIQPSFGAGDSIAGNVVEETVQVLEDSEIYRVRTAGGGAAALKIARKKAGARMDGLLEREAEVLRHLDGSVSPALLGKGELEDGRRYLLIEWLDGASAESVCHELRHRAGAGSDAELLAVCAAILDAYTALHGQRVIHSDIHPRNLLLLPDGPARIIDFGVARIDEAGAGAAPRAGMGFFFEPEYARAVLAKERVPQSSLRGEQYALGALLYYLITGAHYADFSFERDEMLRQIAEEAPLPLERRNVKVPGEIQDTLFRALEKDPARRFACVGDFARAFREAAAGAKASKPASRAQGDELERFVDGVLAQVADPSAPFNYKGPGAPAVSVTYGAAGIAYALHRIARARDDGGVLALADLWAENAAARLDEVNAFYNDEVQITPETVGRISPFHTASGVAAVQAFLAQARGDAGALDQSAARFVELSSGQTDNLDLTLGRSSVLLTLSLLLDATAPAKPDGLLKYGNEVSASIWRELESDGALRKSHRVGYLGLAHGWAGLLYGAMRWARTAGEPLPDLVEPRLDELAELAEPTRCGVRWPVQVRMRGLYMSGWCNGSAGYAHLWTLAHRVFGKQRYLELAERAGSEAYASSGAGHALCCGWAGQAYGQLALYRYTGERKWRNQAEELALRAAELGAAALHKGEDGLPYSLYKGNVGVAVLAAEVRNPESASMPFFEEEGWPS